MNKSAHDVVRANARGLFAWIRARAGTLSPKTWVRAGTYNDVTASVLIDGDRVDVCLEWRSVKMLTEGEIIVVFADRVPETVANAVQGMRFGDVASIDMLVVMNRLTIEFSTVTDDQTVLQLREPAFTAVGRNDLPLPRRRKARNATTTRRS